VLAAWAAIGVWFWRRRAEALPLVAWLWFVVPLAPVSQIVFPLQNRMADRYLLWSVMSVALGVGALSRLAPRGARAGLLLSGGIIAVAGGASLFRSLLFADSARAFRDATEKTQSSLVAPYQLGQALEAKNDEMGARAAYELTLNRATDAEEPARRATNNLAKLCARRGRLLQAEALLRRGVERWPDDAKMAGNLAKVLRWQNRPEEADAVQARSRAGQSRANRSVPEHHE
jgi:hypothetical protein